MTALPNSEDLSSFSTTQGTFRNAAGALVDATREMPGGDFEETLTISGNAVIPTKASFSVDSGGGAGTLNFITPTNHPSGRIVFVRTTSSTKPVTLTNNASGAGKLLLRGSVDYTLTDPAVVVCLRHNATIGAWEELWRGEDFTRQLPDPSSSIFNAGAYPRVKLDRSGYELRMTSDLVTDIGALQTGWHSVFVPAASLSDFSTFKPGALTTYYNGTTGEYVTYRQFSGTIYQQAGISLIIPKSAIGALGGVRCRILGHAASANAGAQMSFVFDAAWANPGDVFTDGTRGTGAPALGITVAPSAANQHYASAWSPLMSVANAADGNIMIGRIYRDAVNDGSNVAFNLVGLEIAFFCHASNDA